MSLRLLHGDCREVLRTLPDASMHSAVTDPPYELGFMGKGWDRTGIAYDLAVWREVLRVLKPGGHLLAFGGTRTYHRMVCAIEDAGFEVRDQIGWVYGSGFPKSLDVAKAIDKARDDRRDILRVTAWVAARRDAAGLTNRDIDAAFGTHGMAGHWTSSASQPAVPTWDQWLRLKGLLELPEDMDAEVWRLNGRKGTPGEAWQAAEVIGEHEGQTPGFGEHRFAVVDRSIREPSARAREWAGWGTALKPAWEPIVVARKPLAGTVAVNVLAHGTGALNIDGCRIPAEKATGWGGGGSALYEGGLSRSGGDARPAEGRWPANLIHDGSDEVLAAFPAEASTTGKRSDRSRAAPVAGTGWLSDNHQSTEYTDSGSPARFFYTAKASAADRTEGLHTITVRGRNHHPTVKPTELMRWLCRLVTPPGGTVLDPFMGTGSTLKAAELEGFDAVGIELDETYLEVARRRIGADAPLFCAVPDVEVMP